MLNVLYSDISLYKFEIYTPYTVHFRDNAFDKCMNHLYVQLFVKHCYNYRPIY